MHPDEQHTDAALVRRLLADQFPQWADLPLEPVPSAGTDNALYRLGNELLVRMPRIHWAVDDVAKEQRWLPYLAPHLPRTVSTPIARGGPGHGYPWDWSIYGWIDGEPATRDAADRGLATDLAKFVSALQRIDPADGPRAAGVARGVDLASRDEVTRERIADLARLSTDASPAALIREWQQALAAPPWERPAVWVHGDLAPGNLLLREGRLAAVIDFGPLAVGDPAVDLLPAWNLLAPAERETYRRELGVDDATWARGRGWALSVAVLALPYYLELGTNPQLVESSWHVLAQLAAAPAG